MSPFRAERAELPPGLQLLVGVLSFRSPVALARRTALRQLIRPRAQVALRFVMACATPDSDAKLPDVWNFSVPDSGRNIGTFLLTNAFFRAAISLRPVVPFVGRADDDAFFSLDAVLHEIMHVPRPQPSEPEPLIYYGPLEVRATVGLEHAFTSRDAANIPGFLRNTAVCARLTGVVHVGPDCDAPRLLFEGSRAKAFPRSPCALRERTCFEPFC